MGWFKVSLTLADIADDKEMEIFWAFHSFAALGSLGAREVALLRVDRHIEGVDLYFSPASVEHLGERLLSRWGATPCERPPRKLVKLFSGQADALEALYSN